MSFLSKIFKNNSEDEEKTEDTPGDEGGDGESSSEDSGDAASSSEEGNPEDSSEESSGDAPSEDGGVEETGDDAPTEESGDNENSEEAPAEESSEEAPPEDSGGEEAPKKDLFLAFLHFCKTNKFLHDLFLIFCVFGFFVALFLSYGEYTKREGLPSFDTLYEQHYTKRIGNAFASGDMDNLLTYLYVDTPDTTMASTQVTDLHAQTAKRLKKEYDRLFAGLSLSVKKTASEYLHTEQGQIHLVTDCYITLSEKTDIILHLEAYQKGKYSMWISTDDQKDEASFHKFNALLHYASTAYTGDTDEDFCYTWRSKTAQEFLSVADAFVTQPQKEPNENYTKQLRVKLKNFEALSIQVKQAYIEPYVYDKETNTKSSSLTLRCVDKQTNTSFVLYQPLTIGLYGYQANGSISIYGSNLRSEVYNACSLLFTE